MKHSDAGGALIGGLGLIIVLGTAIFCPTLDEIQARKAAESAAEETLFPEEWFQETEDPDPELIIEERELIKMDGYRSGMLCDMLLDAKKRPFEPSEVSVEDFTEEVPETAEIAEIGKEDEDERETGAEGESEEVRSGSGLPADGGPLPVAEDDTEVTEVAGTEESSTPEVPAEAPGSTETVVSPACPEDYLRAELEAAGIGWWYPYAWAQIQQESHWDPNAVSADGRDYGLLQYRLSFWDGPGDIMDPYAQIQKYVSQVSARLAAGLGIEETISRHYTSDYCPGINWDYVNAVLQWLQ